MERAQFLRSSPRELDGILERVSLRDLRFEFVPAALICSVIANVHRDPEEKDEPWTMADFLPVELGGNKSKEEEMMDWIDSLDENLEETPDPEALAEFKAKMKATFKLEESGGAQPPAARVTTVGPRGKGETL